MKKEIKSAEEIVDSFKGSNEYPQLITRHEAELACEEYAAQFKQEWVPVEKELPECIDKFNTSDYVMCYAEIGGQFVGWYNSDAKQWIAAIFTSSNDPIISVTHWKKLDPDPDPQPPTI